jgi:hypothetical protein
MPKWTAARLIASENAAFGSSPAPTSWRVTAYSVSRQRTSIGAALTSPLRSTPRERSGSGSCSNSAAQRSPQTRSSRSNTSRASTYGAICAASPATVWILKRTASAVGGRRRCASASASEAQGKLWPLARPSVSVMGSFL